MALQRVWRQNNGQYINLYTDETFRGLMTRKGKTFIQFNDTNAQNTELLRPFFSTHFAQSQIYNGLSDKVDIQNIAGRGRGIVANHDIAVNEVVAISEAYVKVINPILEKYCVACCGQLSSGQCRLCKASLCRTCRDADYSPHYYECRTNFHALPFKDIYMKSVIQMLFITLATYCIQFPDGRRKNKVTRNEFQQRMQQLKNDIETFRNEINYNNDLPLRVDDNDKRTQLRCILALYSADYTGLREEWFEVYNIVMGYPKIKQIFEKDADKHFLGHLLGQFLAIAHSNSFDGQIDGGTTTNTLFHTPSFFNHSCSPNVLRIVTGKTMRCIANRHIARDDELFIGYITFDKVCTTAQRRDILFEKWNFLCRCDRCKSDSDINENQIDQANDVLTNNYNQFMTNLGTIGALGVGWTTNLGAAIIAYQQAIRNQT